MVLGVVMEQKPDVCKEASIYVQLFRGVDLQEDRFRVEFSLACRSQRLDSHVPPNEGRHFIRIGRLLENTNGTLSVLGAS
jgi:hypothetical protein